MLIKHVAIRDILNALKAANERYDGNIKLDQSPRWSGRENGHRLTLRVHDSKASGARRSASGRRTASACWHAYGYFIDALPEQAIILTGRSRIRPGDEWNDIKVGSIYRPAYMSELCDC